MATWLITGCSTGLGRALAQAVLAHGHNAVATARNAATLDDLAAAYPDTALALPLDVTDRAQIGAVVQESGRRFGGVDVPPSLLVLGQDAFGAFGAVAEAERADLDRWRDLSLSTGIGD